LAPLLQCFAWLPYLSVAHTSTSQSLEAHGEDEEGTHPFAGGETLSTAAHYASALTFSASLGKRGNPEHPLQDLINPSWHVVSPLVSFFHETGCIDNEAPYDIHFRTLRLATSDTS